MLNTSTLLLGSNAGNRLQMLSDAMHHLQAVNIKIIQHSNIYQNQAWGLENQPAFLNQVLITESTLSATELLPVLLSIERKMGRVRTKKWEQRCIDIDLLFFNSEIILEKELIVPHPQLHLRRFTLLPLCELIPDYVHPVLNTTIKQLLQECTDDKEVIKY